MNGSIKTRLTRLEQEGVEHSNMVMFKGRLRDTATLSDAEINEGLADIAERSGNLELAARLRDPAQRDSAQAELRELVGMNDE